MLLGVEGRRLFSRRPITVRGGTVLEASVAFPLNPEAMNVQESRVRTPYGEFLLRPRSLSVLDALTPPDGNVVRVRFLSPVLLSSLLQLPPSLWSRFRGRGSSFTVPSPGLILGSAYKVYQGARGRREEDERVFRLVTLANSLSRVTDFRMRPVTVALGEDRDGRLRKVRGVTGWIEFHLPQELRGTLKYLMVGSYLGIGRSRGIGLGEIQVEVGDERTSREAEGRGDLSGEAGPS
ncbi:MAG: CRISPR-associated endoribonuclease Cas6 2 [Metallosphaera javensis (ex Sakai et al. 2022)]|nr:MAG: CRISPR-associated endoribonuclease Cas6 2 [Metallosphaera javensis (ex Sakai et al. 2022)]